MNDLPKRDLLIDYLQGALPDADHRRIEKELSSSPELREELERTQRYLDSMHQLKSERPPVDFLQKVNAKIDRPGFVAGLLRKLFLPLTTKLPFELAGLVAATLIVVVVLKPFERTRDIVSYTESVTESATPPPPPQRPSISERVESAPSLKEESLPKTQKDKQLDTKSSNKPMNKPALRKRAIPLPNNELSVSKLSAQPPIAASAPAPLTSDDRSERERTSAMDTTPADQPDTVWIVLAMADERFAAKKSRARYASHEEISSFVTSKGSPPDSMPELPVRKPGFLEALAERHQGMLHSNQPPDSTYLVEIQSDRLDAFLKDLSSFGTPSPESLPAAKPVRNIVLKIELNS